MMGTREPPYHGRNRGIPAARVRHVSSGDVRESSTNSQPHCNLNRGRCRARANHNGRARGRGRGGYFRNQRGAQSLDSIADFWGGGRGESSVRVSEPIYRIGRDYSSTRQRNLDHLDYKALEKLTTLTPDVVVLELLSTDKRSKYGPILERDEMPPENLSMLVKVISHATYSQSNKESLFELFTRICQQKFFDKLANHAFTVTRSYPKDAKDFFTSLIKFLSSFTDAMITIAIDKLPNSVEVFISALKPIQLKGYVGGDLVKAYEDLQEKLSEATKKWGCEQRFDDKGRKKLKADVEYLQPPEDFRDIPVLPTSVDIIATECPFLRKNIVQGRYRDGHHYLDVQFRLLREDFVRPLRNGINDFRQNCRKIRDVRIYRGVTINEPRIVDHKIFRTVNIHLKNCTENSKRFLFGNLLCFSKDNFKTILFGSVANRDPKMLKTGVLGVQLESEAEVHDLSEKFVMIESRAFFVAYKHVLKAIQETPDDALPMESYIVNVQPNVEPPEYVSNGVSYDLRVIKNLRIMKKSETYNKLFRCRIPNNVKEPVEGELMHLKEVPIENDLTTWPSTKELDLDDSQRRALRSALTRQLAIIQGPPGTGKTFLGLKIVQTLLHNSSAWKPKNHPTPILVVCYTNHALDQFLEGMTSYTSSVIRVGFRTQSETISKFQVNTLARSLRRNLPAAIQSRQCELHIERTQLEDAIKRLRMITNNCNEYSGIIAFELLVHEGIVPQHFQHQLQVVYNDEKFTAWLFNMESENAFAIGNVLSAHNVTNDKFTGGSSIAESISDDDDQDDVEEFNQMEERDRKLEIDNDENCEDITSLLQSFQSLMSSCKQYDVRIQDLEAEMTFLKPYVQTDILAMFRYHFIDFHRDLLYKGLNVPERADEMSELETQMHLNLWQLCFERRWQLYKYWVRKLEEKAEKEIKVLNAAYNKNSRAMDEIRNQEHLHVMRHASIVGMTTTGAAQYNSVLQDLAPAIVVIEEAAEILESHVLTSLTTKCQHLIMIGDHQQLRPSATVYELSIKYGLDISLFERMIKNGLPYETLEYQHRMRPSISKLLVPAVYPELKDHPSVHEFPSIKGVTKDVFFITHQIYEKKGTDDNNSHENLHEAQLIMGLCRHLMLQGYSPNDVTILTPYSGQFFLLRKLQREERLCEHVRISVVDSFQGEENKIILLSLVRSNLEGKVGFLRIENRVCVALSRAKQGLYITGNINLLSASSELWKKIQDDLASMESIGDSLTLQCSNHPEQLMTVSTEMDFFIKSPKGGCKQVCDKPLPRCSHSCPEMCHMNDMEHQQYKCQLPCTNLLCGLFHQCPMKCWEDCEPCKVVVQKELLCGHTHSMQCYFAPENVKCPTLVVRELPNCQHKVKMACHKNPEYISCPMECDTCLDCGHMCQLKCHPVKDPDHVKYKCNEKCTKVNIGCTENHPCLKRCFEDCGLCTTSVRKTLPYQHEAHVKCYRPVEDINCLKYCTVTLLCGHTHQKLCHQPTEGINCQESCLINLPCGHPHKKLCYQPTESITCEKPCERTLPCGHPCKKLCWEVCGDCMVKVKKTIPDCQHDVIVRCNEPATSHNCGGPCPKTLPCGHPCKLRCKNQCTTLCMELVDSVTVCPGGHIFKLPCLLKNKVKEENAWLYCEEPCSKVLDCEHTCEGDCGRCFHGRMHVSCNKPCKKPLVCGHICNQPCCVDCPPCQEACQRRCVHGPCRKKCGAVCTPCKEPCNWECEHMKCDKPCGDQCSRKPCEQPCKKTLEKCGHPCIGFCGDPCPPLCRVCDKEELANSERSGSEDEPDARFVFMEDCGHTIEAKDLKKWLELETAEIGVKKCPKCQKAIYNNRHYHHIILESYKRVKEVESKYNKFSRENAALRKKIEMILIDRRLVFCCKTDASKLAETLGIGPRSTQFSDQKLRLLHFQAQVLERAVYMLQSYQSGISEKVHRVLERVMEQTAIVAPQMMREVSCEMQRLMILSSYQRFLDETPKMYKYYPNDKALKTCAELKKLLNPSIIYEDDLEKKVQKLLKESKPYFGKFQINPGGKVMTVNAVGLKQGYWYKCPNGHVNCIASCKRVMREYRCVFCQGKIMVEGVRKV